MSTMNLTITEQAKDKLKEYQVGTGRFLRISGGFWRMFRHDL